MDKITSIINDLLDELLVKEQEVEKLKEAVKALVSLGDGEPLVRRDVVVNREVERVPPSAIEPTVQAPPPSPSTPRGPTCSACGGEMGVSIHTLSSGKEVQIMKCMDSGCGNEQI